MDSVQLFPFAEYWWFYLCFVAGVAMLLAVDLGIFHREAHEVSMKEAGIWVSIWVSLAVLFNFGLYRFSLWKFAVDPRLQAVPGFDAEAEAWRVALEFFTGYVVEESLSVDNIFVFVIVFKYFGIPARYQHRVLFYGIMGAFFFPYALHCCRFAPDPVPVRRVSLWRFFDIYGDSPHVRTGRRGRTRKEHFDSNLSPFCPRVAFFTRSAFLPSAEWCPVRHTACRHPPVSRGDRHCFCRGFGARGLRDNLRALIGFTSNLSAILGLRSIYFLLAGAINKFHLLKYGLAIVLIFVGLKMVWLNNLYDGHFPIGISLGFIVAVLAVATVASLIWPKTEREGV